MKIAFVWYFDKASQVYDNWRDGLRAAMEIIEQDHKVAWYLDKTLPEEEYDFILFWDDSNSDFFKELLRYDCPKGICLTTWPHNLDNLRMLDVVYVESKPIYEYLRAQGIRTILAFGTDTDFYTPDPNRKKDIPYFYPATFSPWKRQSAIAHLGEDLLCIGTIQPDGKKEYQACVDNNVRVEVGYFPAEKIQDCYQRARNVKIPAIHGSERTVLEAMSCNILPHVNPDNERAKSYVREFTDSGYELPRDFVIENYSHKKYAKDLLRGMDV